MKSLLELPSGPLPSSSSSSAASSLANDFRALFIDDILRVLSNYSTRCWEVSSNHPYNGNKKEPGYLRMPQADGLLVEHDKRSNLNQAHAFVSLYSDKKHSHELGTFSGTTSFDTDLFIPGHQLWYKFESGPLRRQTYEFGYSFRAVPVGYGKAPRASSLSRVAEDVKKERAQCMSLLTGSSKACDSLESAQAKADDSKKKGNSTSQPNASGFERNASLEPTASDFERPVTASDFERTSAHGHIMHTATSTDFTARTAAKTASDGSATYTMDDVWSLEELAALERPVRHGWMLLLLLVSSPRVTEGMVRHAKFHILVAGLSRYLQVARSPFKVFVTRVLSQIWLTALQQPALSSRLSSLQQVVEPLVEIMNTLQNANASMLWGYSPWLTSLLDLTRITTPDPTLQFSTKSIWSLDPNQEASVPGNQNTFKGLGGGWFFYDILRIESLGDALLKSKALPSINLVIAHAFEAVSDLEILRWCLKQPELCLKLDRQHAEWNQHRREWLRMVGNFRKAVDVEDLLLQLWKSLLPVAFTDRSWANGKRSKKWVDKLKAAKGSIPVYADCCLELESALKWVGVDEKNQALGTIWASRRPDWVEALTQLKSKEGKHAQKQEDVFPQRVCAQMSSKPWSLSLYQQLVAYVDVLCDRKERRWQSLGVHDIGMPPNDWVQELGLHALAVRPVQDIRAHFAVIKYFNKTYARVLPLFDFSVHEHWSVVRLVRTCAKKLLFYTNKEFIFHNLFYRLYCEERPQFVILNRLAATQSRERAKLEDSVATQQALAAGSEGSSSPESKLNFYPELADQDPETCFRLHSSLFYQLYRHIGRLNDPSSLRRRGQAWMVKFAGEGGHDVGGMYNESISSVCAELQHLNPVLLPFLVLTPNGRADIGEYRTSFLPNSRCRSPAQLSMIEFIGRLLALGSLEGNGPTPLDLAPVVWKYLSASSLNESDLKAMDYHSWKLMHTMENLAESQVHSSEDFEAVFGSLELTFTRTSAAGEVVELVPGGTNQRVTFDNAAQFASCLLESTLREFDLQLAALARGFASIAQPYHYLKIFTWSQLDRLVTGFADIDVKLLRAKTVYRGRVGEHDTHVQLLWKVLEEFRPEERRSFLQFVWGRSRLPSSVVDFGREMFKIQDHVQAVMSGMPDRYMPVAHTCFFSLELPRYSSKEVLRAKLLYAMRHCSTVDADNTLEGRSNIGMSWEQ